MSLNSSFWFKKRPAGQAELDGAIEFISQPALVMDAMQRVLAANKLACQLLNRSQAELNGKRLSEIILLPDDIEPSAPLETNPKIHLCELTLPGQNCQDVKLRLSWLSSNGDYLLATFDLVPLRRASEDIPEPHALFWQGLYLLASAAEQPTLDQCLRTAMEGARTLLPCQHASLYLCKTSDLNASGTETPTIPLANRSATRWGDDETLPETVAPQDLVMLRTIRVWDRDKRPPTNLHRAARDANLSYLAVAPLGLPQKLTGLIVLGDKETDPPAELLRMIQLVATQLSHILEEQERRVQMNRTLDSQALLLRVDDVALGAVQDGVFVLSPELKIRHINQAIETIFGYKNREVENQPIDQILIGSELVNPALNLAMSGAPTYHLNNIKLLRRYGEKFQALVRVQPVMQLGEVESILVIVRDLSEQAAYEAHARQLAQHAELGEVMAAFSHEVRNPIHNISSGLQVLERMFTDDGPMKETVQNMLMDVDRVAELMKSMLSVTRTTDIKPRPVDLGKIVNSLVERLKPGIAREDISCQCTIEPGMPMINGDTRALEQVFNNLIRNAIQAMKGRPQSQLIVRVQSQKAARDRIFLEVTIADNGPGIPKENQDKIFQPFFTTRADGNGLGLPLAKRIITAHKGSITVTSFPGGTVFKVIIPAYDRSRQTGPLPALDETFGTLASQTPVENNS